MANVTASFLELVAADKAAESRSAHRQRLFGEGAGQMLQRWLMGMAYALHPKRIADLPFLLWHAAGDLLRGGTRLPDPARTVPRPDTFGGICRDISPETVLAAARLGFFPWSHVGPLKWWTRKERMLLVPAEYRIAKDARRLMRRNAYTVTFDTAFDEVLVSCAGRRRNRPPLTWITPRIMQLYSQLHTMGHAHSFEVWNGSGELVGGGYGLAVGRVFITESMFSMEPNTSKIGFATLNHHLAKWGFVANDGKDWSFPLEQAGMKLVPRAEHERLLALHAHTDERVGSWSVEADTAAAAA